MKTTIKKKTKTKNLKIINPLLTLYYYVIKCITNKGFLIMKMLTFYNLVDAQEYIFDHYDWHNLQDLDRLYNEYIFMDKDDDIYKEYFVPANMT